MAKTSTDLVTNIRRRSQLSQDAGQALSDADVLALASDELQNVIGPRVYAMRGWHYAAKQLYALGVQRYYRVPDRAAGGTIISVEIVNSSPPNRMVNLVHPLQSNQSSGQSSGESYYIYANNIILSSGCPSSGNMIVRYLLPPSTIGSKAIEPISSVITTPGSNSMSGTSVGGGPVTQGVPALYDIYRTTSPYEIIVAGVPGTATSSGVSFSINVLSTQSVLDQYSIVDNLSTADLAAMASTVTGANGLGISDAGSSYHPQLNDEFHDYLAHRTAMRCMESIGHTEDLENMAKKLVDLERSFNQAISPRERGDIKVILQEDFYYDRRF